MTAQAAVAARSSAGTQKTGRSMAILPTARQRAAMHWLGSMLARVIQAQGRLELGPRLRKRPEMHGRDPGQAAAIASIKVVDASQETSQQGIQKPASKASKNGSNRDQSGNCSAVRTSRTRCAARFLPWHRIVDDLSGSHPGRCRWLADIA